MSTSLAPARSPGQAGQALLWLALVAAGGATIAAIGLPGGLFLHPDSTVATKVVWLVLGALFVVRGWRWAWWLATFIAAVGVLFALAVGLTGDAAALVAAPPAAAGLWLLVGPVATADAVRHDRPPPSRRGLIAVGLLAVVFGFLPALTTTTLMAG